MTMNSLAAVSPTKYFTRTSEPLGEVILDARGQLLDQSRALAELAERLDESFTEAVRLALFCRGRLVVSGMGKSGHVGRKIAATLSSTGTPSFFLHASEALHGDLGMVTADDVVLMISNSGETTEVLRILRLLDDLGVPIIGMAGNKHCTLARSSRVFLDIGVDREACPHNLAPTTSTLVTLALGDALALAVSQARGFQPHDFARFHSGGSLGRRLCTRVSDVMHTKHLPFVRPGQDMQGLVVSMTTGRCGLAIVVEEGDELVGIVTDGDLRRAFQSNRNAMTLTARDIMTTSPVVIHQDALLGEAEELMLARRISALLAVDDEGLVTGIVDIYCK